MDCVIENLCLLWVHRHYSDKHFILALDRQIRHIKAYCAAYKPGYQHSPEFYNQ